MRHERTDESKIGAESCDNMGRAVINPLNAGNRKRFRELLM
jgi:hypothetical protein